MVYLQAIEIGNDRAIVAGVTCLAADPGTRTTAQMHGQAHPCGSLHHRISHRHRKVGLSLGVVISGSHLVIDEQA